MSGDSVRPPNAASGSAFGALVAGITLIAVPLIPAVSGSTEPLEPIFWIMWVVGAVMLVYGTAALLVDRRNEPARRSRSDEARVVLDFIRGP